MGNTALLICIMCATNLLAQDEPETMKIELAKPSKVEARFIETHTIETYSLEKKIEFVGIAAAITAAVLVTDISKKSNLKYEPAYYEKYPKYETSLDLLSK